jgi:hypothetical protein
MKPGLLLKDSPEPITLHHCFECTGRFYDPDEFRKHMSESHDLVYEYFEEPASTAEYFGQKHGLTKKNHKEECKLCLIFQKDLQLDSLQQKNNLIICPMAYVIAVIHSNGQEENTAVTVAPKNIRLRCSLFGILSGLTILEEMPGLVNHSHGVEHMIILGSVRNAAPSWKKTLMLMLITSLQ